MSSREELSKLTVPVLVQRAKNFGIVVKRSSGSGKPLKADYVEALLKYAEDEKEEEEEEKEDDDSDWEGSPPYTRSECGSDWESENESDDDTPYRQEKEPSILCEAILEIYDEDEIEESPLLKDLLNFAEEWKEEEEEEEKREEPTITGYIQTIQKVLEVHLIPDLANITMEYVDFSLFDPISEYLEDEANAEIVDYKTDDEDEKSDYGDIEDDPRDADLIEMVNEQQKVGFCIPQNNFWGLAEEILQEYKDAHFSIEAVKALQTAAEDFLIQVFNNAGRMSETIDPTPSHIGLAAYLLQQGK